MAKTKKSIQQTTEDTIEVFGAREHNLKNINISIPKNKLVVFTGVSGIWKALGLMQGNL